MSYELAEQLTMDLLVWVGVAGLAICLAINWLLKP